MALPRFKLRSFMKGKEGASNPSKEISISLLPPGFEPGSMKPKARRYNGELSWFSLLSATLPHFPHFGATRSTPRSLSCAL